MRICLVSQEYPPGRVGGIGTQTRVKAHALAALGHQVEVLTVGNSPGASLRSRREGLVSVHELRSPGSEFEVYRTETFWIGYSWTVLGALRELQRRSAFEVIDFPDYGAEGFAFQLDREPDDDTAVVVHLHGSLRMFSDKIGWPEHDEPLHRVGTFMEDLSLEFADGLLAASRSIAELTTRALAVPLGRVQVVLGAVDSELFCPAPEPGASSSEGLRLLFVGSLAANKGIWTVLEAFIHLASAHPRVSLTVAGTADDGIVDELRMRAVQAGVDDRLTMLGFVEHAELPELYRSADVLVAPSQYEGGLGMVYLEAMACGLPVVASAAGGAAEAVANGETGILLERGEVMEAVAALATLRESRELRLGMGAAGRARVQELFTPRRYATRIASAYERAIEHRRASLVSW
jgi:glycogen synthase